MLLRNAVFFWNDAGGGICVCACVSGGEVERSMQMDSSREEPSSGEWREGDRFAARSVRFAGERLLERMMGRFGLM